MAAKKVTFPKSGSEGILGLPSQGCNLFTNLLAILERLTKLPIFWSYHIGTLVQEGCTGLLLGMGLSP